MQISVKQGQIHVNSIHLVKQGPGLNIYAADLRAKYAEVNGVLGDGPSQTLMLEARENTLHAENSAELTEITFTLEIDLPFNARLEATVGKYTLYIFLWHDDEEKLVWEDNDRNNEG